MREKISQIIFRVFFIGIFFISALISILFAIFITYLLFNPAIIGEFFREIISGF